MASFQCGGNRSANRRWLLGDTGGNKGSWATAIPCRALRIEPLEERTLLDAAGFDAAGLSEAEPPRYGPLDQHAGSVTTQGDAALRADLVRQSPGGFTGSGVKIGVLSDSVNRIGSGLAGSQATGDLPPDVIVLRDGPATGVTDQGRAMLEVIHDVAPGATLVFRSAAWGELDFARAIHELAEAGCDVIVDGTGYWTEPALADGPVAQAIDHVVNVHGVAYFSAAGDAGAMAYEAVFRDSQPAEWDTAVNYALGRNLHDFDPGPGVDVTLRVQVLAQARLVLQWDQPWYTPGQPLSNFDLYAFDVAGNLAASSTADNAALRTPLESVVLGPGPYELQINHVSGPEGVHLKLWAAQGQVAFGEYPQESGRGTIAGHAAAAGAATVAAAPYAGYAAGQIEPSSSRGPAMIYLDAGYDRLATPQTRTKPNFTAPDGGNTTFFGQDDGDSDTWPNFYGTSAAAAHAAAVAALLLQQRPTLSPRQLYQLLADTAADGGTAGWDPTYGAGMIDAWAASTALVDPANYADTVGPWATEFSVPERTAGPVDRFTVWFDEELDAVPAEQPGNYELRAWGPDERFDTADDTLVPLAISYDDATRSVVVDPAGILGPGVYRLTLRSGPGGLRDVSGNPLAEGRDQTRTFGIGGLEGEVPLAQQAYALSWPDVAINSSGQRVAVWADSTGQQGSARVLVQSYAATGRPVLPFPLELEAAALNRTGESNRNAVLPSVAMAEDGRFVVAYEGLAADSQAQTHRAVFVQRFHADGTLLGEPILADIGWLASPADQAAPDVAIRPDGAGFVVVWEEGGAADSSRSIQAVLYDWNGTASSSVLAVNTTGITSSTTPWMIEPAVAMNASGQFAVAWARLSGGTYTTYVRRFDAAGTPQTAEIAVGSGTASGNHGWTPDVAIDDQGNFIVAFGNADTFVARYSPNGQLREPAFRANLTTTGSQMDPALALNPQTGDLLVVWRSTGQDGAGSQGVFGRFYDSAANPRTAEFQVHQTTAYHESYPAAAMNRQGDAWIAWQAFETLPNRAHAVYARWIPGSLPPDRPDAIAAALEAPGPLGPGEALDLKATIYNAGLSPTGPVDLRLYLSDDAQVTTADTPLGPMVTVPSIGPGASWTTNLSAAIPVNARRGSRYVGLLVDPEGKLEEIDRGNNVLVQPVAISGPLLGLEAERVVNATTTGDQRRPRVAMDDAGNAVVVWWGNGPGDTSGVFFQRFDAEGSPQGPETRVNTTVSGTQTAAALAMNRATGDFVVAWASDQAGTWDIYFRRFDAQGNPRSNETLAHTSTAGTQDQPAAGMDDAGRFVLAWCTGSTPKVVVQRFDAQGNRLGEPVQAETASYPGTSGLQARPAVAMNGPGEFVVAWQSATEEESANYGVYFQRFDAEGRRLGTQTLAHLRNPTDQAAPAIGLADNGTLVVAWHSLGQEQQGTPLPADRGVYFQRFDPQNLILSAGVAPSFPVADLRANAYVVSDQDEPALAVLRSGAWILAWQSLGQDGAENGVYFRRYRPDGSPHGGVWQANTTMADSQQYPAVAAAAQTFALVWESRLQDGAGWGLVTRRWTEVELDFGDAPAPYPTLAADDGPSHVLVAGFYLGSGVDSEPDGMPSAASDGDDLAGWDDEDGAVFTTPLVPGRVAAEAIVTASASGRLDAWIDWNHDGDFEDLGEAIARSLPLAPGPNPLRFDVPLSAGIASDTVARFRFSSAGGLGPTGVALDGEIEDHLVAVLPPPTIDVGTHLLVAEEPGQTLAIRAAGRLPVDGMNFRIQIGDGSGQGPSPALVAPLDLTTGTIFEGKNTGQTDTTIQPAWATARIETAAGQTVLADGIIATVSVSTLGVPAGTWPLRMSSTVAGPADFLTLPAAIADGQIVVKHRPQAVLQPANPAVPENGALWLDAANSFHPDPGEAIASYEWDLDNDGTFETFGPQALFSAAGRDGPDTQIVRLRVVDTNGIYSNVVLTEVTITDVPPVIALAGPATVDEGSPWVLQLGEITDPGADTPTRWIVHWGDGTQEEFFSPGAKSHVYADGPAQYPVTVDVEDEDGLHLAAGSTSVSVQDVPPAIAVWGPATVAEGSPWVLQLGEITDPGADTPTRWIVHWGDGTQEEFFSPGAKSHVYADGPAQYPVTVDVEDEDGLHLAAGSTSVSVQDVPPAIAVWGPATVDEGSPWVLQLGEITDPGADTPTRWIVHWGDGTQEEFFSPGAKSHVYADGPAQYPVTVDVEDEDGLHLAAGTTTVSVANVAPWAVMSAPGAVDEGSAVFVALAEAQDASPADIAAGLRYAWDFGNDGTWEVGVPEYAGASTQSVVQVPRSLVADGDRVVPVLGRIIDKDNAWQQYLTQIVVRNVPPLAEPGGPYRVEEAGTVTLHGTGSDPAGSSDPLVFLWDLDGDGQFGEQGPAAARGDELGPSPRFEARGLHGPRYVTVALVVTDDEGATSPVARTAVLVEPDQSTIGLFSPAAGAFYLKFSNTATGSDVTAIEFRTNMTGYQALVGDWDGDGVDTIGVFVPSSGAFYLKHSNTATGSDVTAIEFRTNMTGYQALVGDWDGDGVDTIGVFVPSTGAFYLKHSNTATGSDVTAIEFHTNMAGFRAMAGDWNRDGADTIGVFVPGSGTFYLKDTNTPAGGDVTSISFGANLAGWQPVGGDWVGPAGAAGSGALLAAISSATPAVDAALVRLAETPLAPDGARAGPGGFPRWPAQVEDLAWHPAVLAAMQRATSQAKSPVQEDVAIEFQAVDAILARLQRLAELGE